MIRKSIFRPVVRLPEEQDGLQVFQLKTLVL